MAGAYFAVTALSYVVRYGTRLFVRDHVAWLHKYFEVDPVASVVFRPFGHPKVLPHLLYIVDLRLFDGSQELLLGFGYAMAVVMVAGIGVAIAREPGMSVVERSLALALALATTFWMGNNQMFLWGFESVQAHLLCALFVLGLLLFAGAVRREREGRPATARMVQACVLCTLASLCFGTGLATLPALVVLGLAFRLPLRLLSVPVAFLGLCLFLYLDALPRIYDAVRPADAFPASSTTDSIALGPQTAPFALEWIGAFGGVIFGAIAGDDTEWTDGPLALSVGAAVVSIVVLFLVRSWRRRGGASRLDIVGLGLAVFGVGVAVQIALARVSVDVGNAFAERYMVWRSALFCGVALLLVNGCARARRARPRAAGLVLAGLAALLPAMVPSHWVGVRRFVTRDGMARTSALATVMQVDDRLRMLNALFPRVRPYMEERGLNWFGWPHWQVLGRRASDVYEIEPGEVRGAYWRVAELLAPGADGGVDARIEGQAVLRGGRVPPLVAVLDSEGIIRGLAVPAAIGETGRRVLDLGRFDANLLAGYIKGYHPEEEYGFLAVLAGYERAVAFHPRRRRSHR